MKKFPTSPQLNEIKQALLHHPLYQSLKDEAALRKFMQTHVYCVWDFQSILKVLQRRFTGLDIPWTPSSYPQARRLINEIVLEEESDEHPDGGYASHFELYLEAMKDCGAEINGVNHFLDKLKQSPHNFFALLETHPFPSGVASFLQFTFKSLNSCSDHELVALFTLGREDLIPELFHEIVTQLEEKSPQWSKFRYYLDRHIDIDSDKHAPMAFELLQLVCDGDSEKEAQAQEIALQALQQRLQLWNHISESLD